MGGARSACPAKRDSAPAQAITAASRAAVMACAGGGIAEQFRRAARPAAVQYPADLEGSTVL